MFVQKQGAGLKTNGSTTSWMMENVFGTNRSFLGPKGFFDMYITSADYNSVHLLMLLLYLLSLAGNSAGRP